MNAPKMPEIRQAIEQARALTGQEDTNEFAVEAPGLLARLVAILDLYVGHEPTLAEEAAYVRAKVRAEVLTEAADVAEQFTEQWPDLDAMKADGIIGPFTAIGRIADQLREMAGKDTGGAQAPAGESTQPAPDLHGTVRGAITASQGPLLPLPAHTVQLLTDRVTAAVTPLLGRVTEQRDYWHAELMCADARIAELGRKVAAAQPAGRCGRALATGQRCPDHPAPSPRSYWDAIATALNAANAAGMPVGIDIEGILTDHHTWAVVWNRAAERWEVGDYEDDSPQETPGSVEDWVICCSPNPRCPNGERRGRAVERGWTTNGRAGNWLCAEHSPSDFFRPGRTYTEAAWAFRCDTVTTHPETRVRTALGWTRIKDSGWTPYSHTEDDWADGTWAEATGPGDAV